MGFFDKFLGYIALPVALHVGGRANLHQTAQEGYNWVISLGRDGYERALRAYAYAAPKPVIAGLLITAVLEWVILAIAQEAVEGEQSGLFRSFTLVMYAFLVMHAAYAWWQRKSIAILARNDDGTPVRDAEGERQLDEDYVYIPQRLSLKTSAALIVASGLTLAFGLLVAGAAYESRLLLVLGVVSFAIPITVLFAVLNTIVWATKKMADVLESATGFAREQIIVLAAGHTFETITRGAANIVRQENWKPYLDTALKLLVSIYLQQILLQLAYPNWSWFLFVSGLNFIVLIASALRWEQHGRLQVLNAMESFSSFQFKWIPWIAGVILAWQLLLPQEVKDLPSDAWSWIWAGLHTDKCLPVERRWGRNLGVFLLCIIPASVATHYFFKLMGKMKENGWLLRAAHVVPAVVAGLAMIGFGYGTLRGVTFLVLNAADADKTPICSPLREGETVVSDPSDDQPKDEWEPLKEAGDTKNEKPAKRDWSIKPPALAPSPTVVVQAQPQDVPNVTNEPKLPAYAPKPAEQRLASERERSPSCTADFIAMYERKYHTSPPCAP